MGACDCDTVPVDAMNGEEFFSGSTWNGVEMEMVEIVVVDGVETEVPMTLEGATIECDLRLKRDETLVQRWAYPTEDGAAAIVVTGNIFELSSAILTGEGVAHGDVKIQFANEEVKTGIYPFYIIMQKTVTV